MTDRRAARLAAVLAAAVAPALVNVGSALAQPAARPGTPAARPGAPAAPAAAPARAPGLDGLSDEVVMDELAGRGLNSLLNRLYTVHNTPQADRASRDALQAVRELGGNRPYTDAKRIELLGKSVKGLRALLPKLTDPNKLMLYASYVMAKGLEPDIFLLEYFGENPSTMGRVRPAAQIATEMLKKVAVDATARGEQVANTIQSPNDTAKIQQVQALEGMATQAKYVANTSMYYEVMGIDGSTPKGLADRKAAAAPAIKELKEYDNNASGVASQVKLLLGKLYLAQRDFANARKSLQGVVDAKVDNEAMQPPPAPFQVNEAKYFLVLADLFAGDPAAAEKSMAALAAWQPTALKGTNADEQKEIDRAIGGMMAMLKYRVLTLKSEKAGNPTDKKKAGDEADAVLTALATSHPEYKQLITEQQLSKLPEDADLTKQSIPVLQALITRGNGQRLIEGEEYDKKMLQRGLDAAKVMATRKPGEGGASEQMVDIATLLVPMFLQKQGKVIEAANAYLDYGTNPQYMAKPNAALAVDQGAFTAFTEFGKDANNPERKALYARALKIVTDEKLPFVRKELFYAAGDWYRAAENNYPLAISYYLKVPAGDKNEFNAKYWAMDSYKYLVKDAKTDADRTAAIAAQAKMIDEVRKMSLANLNAADPKLQTSAKIRLSHATLLGAELALAAKDPKRTLQLLQNFENNIQGVQGAENMGFHATFLRAQALRRNNQIAEAFSEVEKLCKAPEPKVVEMGFGMASDSLETLTKEFTAAEKAKDQKTMAEVADTQAKYLNLLMPWIRTNKDPKIAEHVNEYVVFEGDVRRNAGLMTQDPAKRADHLKAAADIYKGVIPVLKKQADDFDKLKTSKDPNDQAKAKRAQDIRQQANSAQFKLARIAFDLGDFRESGKAFFQLLNARQLGSATTEKRDPVTGAVSFEDNSAFWEGQYKYVKSNVEVIKATADADMKKKYMDTTVQVVQDLYVTYGNRTGGDVWADEIEALRVELQTMSGREIKRPAAAAGGAPATGPATAPAPAAATAPTAP